jgi:hypothetical protein
MAACGGLCDEDGDIRGTEMKKGIPFLLHDIFGGS